MGTDDGTSAAKDTSSRAVVDVGDIIAGKFRVERILGEGGMGVVAEATHLQLEERVALKFLRPTMLLNADIVARFSQEARAAVKLKSEHVARVYDVGMRDDGAPFIVMEYLEGQDLAETVRSGGALPVPAAVEYIIQACEGVAEAHARGIVHRDIKPDNLFLVQRSDGWRLVKVLDFGISKAALTGKVDDVDLGARHTTNIMGSPYYMSPEQLRSTRNVDHRADIWSLGTVLFELLTGVTAFYETDHMTELVALILETPHRRLSEYRPDAPVDLEAVIDRCLEKDRTRRFQNAAELAIALLPFAPRRARVSVERTTSVTRAAGLLSNPNIQLPPSYAPPPLEYQATVPPGTDGRASGTPARQTTSPGLGSAAPGGSSPQVLGEAATVAPPSAERASSTDPGTSGGNLAQSVTFTGAAAAPKRRPWAFALLALFTGIGLWLAFGRRGDTSAAQPGSPISATPSTPEPAAATSTLAVPPTSPELPSASAAPPRPESAGAKPAVAKPRHAPVPSAAPSTAATAKPAPPPGGDLDIRRTR